MLNLSGKFGSVEQQVDEEISIWFLLFAHYYYVRLITIT